MLNPECKNYDFKLKKQDPFNAKLLEFNSLNNQFKGIQKCEEI